MSKENKPSNEKVKEHLDDAKDNIQPRFVPGYTGFCPGIKNKVGENYSRTTQNILQHEPSVAGRLSLGPGSDVAKEERQRERDKKLIDSCTTSGRPGLGAYMPPGYTGHIPGRMMCDVGRSYGKSCTEAVAKLKRSTQEDEKDKY